VGVTVYTSCRLEDLFDALLEQLTQSPAGPMATETILVPGQGVARWLELRIADHLGIASGIEMPFLSSYFQRLSSGGVASSRDLFSREVMVLRLWRLMSERLHTKDNRLSFGAAANYCKHDDDGRKHLQLCSRLAACFDDYQLYRDDLLTSFSRGDDHKSLSPHAVWQARIWRALIEDAGLALPQPRSRKANPVETTPFLFAEMANDAEDTRAASDTAHRLVALRAHLEDQVWRRSHLPPRLSVFGTTTMPPALLDVLHRVAEHIPVRMYVPQPTPHYVGDLRERTNKSGDNALLARFGTESREFQSLLVDLEDRATTSAPVDLVPIDSLDEHATPVSLLGSIQHDIVHAIDRGESEYPSHQISIEDASLRVHDCHSAQRELEVVRDQIFAALTDDPSLEARDFLVLVPDIDQYAPYAHAVFGPVKYSLPFHVADRHPARELPICRSLLAVLALASTRVTLADVLQLLENTAVQRRFGLFPNDIAVIRHLCQDAGIRWGLDGDSRHDQFHLPAFDDNAWEQGLDRLLLGSLTGPVEDLVLKHLPVGDTTEARAELVAKFVSFSRTLFAHVRAIREPHSFSDWAARIDTISNTLFTPTEGDHEDALRQLKTTTTKLRENARTAGHNQEVSLAVLRDWMHDALGQGSASRGFLGGSITIAAMLPMRAVPMRCLFICGLDDEAFPRQLKPTPFDLIAAKPRPGDRNRRLDDRQLFLDLLMCARDRLHLSYIGRSAKDNAEGAPSIVLSELFDHIDRTCHSNADHQGLPHKQIVVRHPLQPWSRRYHDGSDHRLFTYATQTRSHLGSTKSGEHEAWCPEDLHLAPADGDVAGVQVVDIDDLLKFWWHPCSAFLSQTLRMRMHRIDDPIDADEPFSIDALTRFQLQDEAVRDSVRGDGGPANPLDWTRAQGVLPVGSHGVATHRALRAETHQLSKEANRHVRTASRLIDLTVGETRIHGTIDGFTEQDLTYLRASKIKPKDRLRAWILHLVVTAQRLQDGDDHTPAWPSSTRVLSIDGAWSYSDVPDEDAAAQLELLLSLYLAGQSRPLPFFEQSSYAAGESYIANGDDLKALQKGLGKYAVSDAQAAWKSDEGDESIALCMRNRDPFDGGVDSEFLRLAKSVWTSPIEYLRELT